jgi:hypothetical protein
MVKIIPAIYAERKNYLRLISNSQFKKGCIRHCEAKHQTRQASLHHTYGKGGGAFREIF